VVARVGTSLGPIWDQSGTSLGPVWDQPGTSQGWVPIWQPMWQKQWVAAGKGKGKGKKKGGGGHGGEPREKKPVVGCGGGGGGPDHRGFASDNKIWIGNLPQFCTQQALHGHVMQFNPEVKWVEVFTKKTNRGTGTACFATEREALEAAMVLNGTELGGNVLVVSSWTRKEPKPPAATAK